MSDHVSQRSALLAQFKEHLAKVSYSSSAVAGYVAVAAHLLEYLGNRHVPVDAVQPLHVTTFLRRELRRFTRRHGHAPVSIDPLARLTYCWYSSVTPLDQRAMAPERCDLQPSRSDLPIAVHGLHTVARRATGAETARPTLGLIIH